MGQVVHLRRGRGQLSDIIHGRPVRCWLGYEEQDICRGQASRDICGPIPTLACLVCLAIEYPYACPRFLTAHLNASYQDKKKYLTDVFIPG